MIIIYDKITLLISGERVLENKRFSWRRAALPALAAVLFIALLLLLIFFGGGGSDDEPKSRTYYDLFDTVSTVYDYTDGSNADFEENLGKIEELLCYYDSLFDIYEPHEVINNLYTVNENAGVSPVKVDAELIEFLEYSKEMYILTGGEVNIAMGAVLSIWHGFREAGISDPSAAALPPAELLSEAAEHCNIDAIIIDKDSSTVYLSDPEMSLDVGAIAKGYATEMAAELLYERGVSGYALDIGGNLRTVGTKPDGSAWRTGVRNPNTASDERYVYYFDLSDGSAVTSGDYERYYTVEGKKYHHIIDKDTLIPSEYFASVTVITESSALADALSTALYCMDYESGEALIKTLDGVRAIWVYQNGEVKEAQ